MHWHPTPVRDPGRWLAYFAAQFCRDRRRDRIVSTPGHYSMIMDSLGFWAGCNDLIGFPIGVDEVLEQVTRLLLRVHHAERDECGSLRRFPPIARVSRCPTPRRTPAASPARCASRLELRPAFQARQEIGKTVGEGVLVADRAAGHPPVLHVGMLEIRDVDLLPAGQVVFDLLARRGIGVAEEIQQVRVFQVEEHGAVLAVEFQRAVVLPARA